MTPGDLKASMSRAEQHRVEWKAKHVEAKASYEVHVHKEEQKDVSTPPVALREGSG